LDPQVPHVCLSLFMSVLSLCMSPHLCLLALPSTVVAFDDFDPQVPHVCRRMCSVQNVCCISSGTSYLCASVYESECTRARAHMHPRTHKKCLLVPFSLPLCSRAVSFTFCPLRALAPRSNCRRRQSARSKILLQYSTSSLTTWLRCASVIGLVCIYVRSPLHLYKVSFASR
jgi:hypothetical protein